MRGFVAAGSGWWGASFRATKGKVDVDEKTKPKFSDVVGALVSGVAQARSIADVEALRIAHRYGKIEHLKGLPVPRLRLKAVSISIPMLISEIVPQKPCEPTTKEELAAEVERAADKAIARILEVAVKEALSKSTDETKRGFMEIAKEVQNKWNKGGIGPDFKKKVKDVFVDALKERLEETYQKLNITPAATPAPDTVIRDTVGEVAREVLRDVLTDILLQCAVETKLRPFFFWKKPSEGITESDYEKMGKTFFANPIVQSEMEKVQNEAASAAVKVPTIPPDFYISADTETIKNAGGGPDVVTRFNMVLLEEGLEWVTETRDGVETTKLMQE